MTDSNDSTDTGDTADADVRTDVDPELDAAFDDAPADDATLTDDVTLDHATLTDDSTTDDVTTDDTLADATRVDGAVVDVAVVAAAARGGASIRLSLIVAAAVLVLDQVTKHWAVNALSDGASRQVFWKLHWNLAYNSGMAFSRGQGIGPYIGALALVVVVALVLSLRKATGRGSALAVGLVVGGACGNLADRLFRGDGWLHGSVIDFIDFEFWPIFNIADMGVSIGGVLIVLAALLDGRTRTS